MKYYIMMPGETNAESAMFESNLLGEASFKVFWAAQGLKGSNEDGRPGTRNARRDRNNQNGKG